MQPSELSNIFNDLKYERSRLLTLPWFAQKLAFSGMYRSSDGTVQCVFCQLKNARSLRDHFEKSPTCPFFTCPDNGNIPIGVTKGYKKAAYPNMATLEARLATFETYPPLEYFLDRYQLKESGFFEFGEESRFKFPSGSNLAEWGFFYVGVADLVKCFCCGNILHNWNAGDDPYEEHRKLFDKCLYLNSVALFKANAIQAHRRMHAEARELFTITPNKIYLSFADLCRDVLTTDALKECSSDDSSDESSNDSSGFEEYCCSLECFKLPSDQVDGIACSYCEHFSYCMCECKNYMEWFLGKYCCPKKCVLKMRKCDLCQGEYCCCLCESVRLESLKETDQIVKVNGKLVELVSSKEEGFCCQKECFKKPKILIRGLACMKCRAVNYCKCECKGHHREEPIFC